MSQSLEDLFDDPEDTLPPPPDELEASAPDVPAAEEPDTDAPELEAPDTGPEEPAAAPEAEAEVPLR